VRKRERNEDTVRGRVTRNTRDDRRRTTDNGFAANESSWKGGGRQEGGHASGGARDGGGRTRMGKGAAGIGGGEIRRALASARGQRDET